MKKSEGLSTQGLHGLPHFRRIVKLGDTLGPWWTASRKTEASHKDPLSFSQRLRQIDDEIDKLDAAELELHACLAKFSPLWVGDRRAVRETLEKLQARRETLEDRKNNIHAVIQQSVGVNEMLVQAYSRVGVEINPRTTALEEVIGGVGVAGQGNVHTVELVECVQSEPSTGELRTVTKVFKAEPDLSQGLSDVGGALGITQVPNLSGRAVASFEIDQLMATNLVPSTRFAIHHQQLGVVMDWVDGSAVQVTGSAVLPVDKAIVEWATAKPAELQRYARGKGFSGAEARGSTIVFHRFEAQTDADEFGVPRRNAQGEVIVRQVPGPISLMPENLGKDPVFLARLSDANCLAYLSNQGDWHGGNYKLQFDAAGKVADLRFFDNDLSFGTKSPGTDFDLESAFGGGSATHMTQLPPVITTRTHDAVMSLSSDDIAAVLRELLSPDDISAAQHRLEVLQLHCVQCRQAGLVLDEADPAWAGELVQRQFGLDRLEAARGDLARLKALEPELKRANLPVRELLAMYQAEARSRSADSVAADEAVAFDAQTLKGELTWIAAAAS